MFVVYARKEGGAICWFLIDNNTENKIKVKSEQYIDSTYRFGYNRYWTNLDKCMKCQWTQ